MLSIIIPTIGEERIPSLTELVDSLLQQSFRQLEVIIVCDSREMKEKLAACPWPPLSPIRILVNDPPSGASGARNLGARNSSGEILAFLDDDVVALSGWAASVIEAFQDSSVVGVTGPAYPLWKTEPLEWLPTEFSWIVGSTAWRVLPERHSVLDVSGMNVSYRRGAFLSTGSYSERLGPTKGYDRRGGWRRLGGEENDVAIRIIGSTGKKIVYDPQVQVLHRVRRYNLTPAGIVRRSFHVGQNRALLRQMRGILPAGSYPSSDYFMLRRIATQLFSRILSALMRHPILGWKMLSVSLSILTAVGIGFTVQWVRVRASGPIGS